MLSFVHNFFFIHSKKFPGITHSGHFLPFQLARGKLKTKESRQSRGTLLTNYNIFKCKGRFSLA